MCPGVFIYGRPPVGKTDTTTAVRAARSLRPTDAPTRPVAKVVPNDRRNVFAVVSFARPCMCARRKSDTINAVSDACASIHSVRGRRAISIRLKETRTHAHASTHKHAYALYLFEKPPPGSEIVGPGLVVRREVFQNPAKTATRFVEYTTFNYPGHCGNVRFMGNAVDWIRFGPNNERSLLACEFNAVFQNVSFSN